jgi:hypothetical protein
MGGRPCALPFGTRIFINADRPVCLWSDCRSPDVKLVDDGQRWLTDLAGNLTPVVYKRLRRYRCSLCGREF